MVAACSASAISAPVKVAPTMTRPILVDDDARGARRAVADERAAGVAAGGDVDGAGDDAGLLGAGQVWPTAATCGSVKVTRGLNGPSLRTGTSRPRMQSAAIRPWYLPMWVSRARPLASPMT